MSYSEQDRAYIYRFMGMGAVFAQADTRLDGAIRATQSVADGGGRPDSTIENEIKCHIYGWPAVTGSLPTPGGTPSTGPYSTPAIRGLLQIEAAIANLDVQQGALQAEDVKIDSAREMLRLRMEGRRNAFSMARMLGFKGVRADIFSGGGGPEGDEDPFANNESPFY